MDKLKYSNLIDDWLNKNGTEEMRKQVELEIIEYNKLISQFERLEGISSNLFDKKDWDKFDRFVKNRQKE